MNLRSQRGASAVEFALISTVLFLVVFGIIEFGVIFNDYIGMRQGSRDGARAAVVADWGTDSSCSLTGAGEANVDTRRVMCLTKERADIDPDRTRVKVLLGSSGYAEKEPLIVCTQYEVESIGGMLAPFVDDLILTSKVQMRIERSKLPGLASADEDAPAGGDWTWCTVA